MNSLSKLYKKNGYHFIAITDHRIYYKKDDEHLDGCEYNCYLDLDERYHFHLLTLNNGQTSIEDNDNTYKSLFYTKLEEVQDFINLLKSKGNMVFIAHPKNILIPLEMLMTLNNYDGIEVFNSKADSDASDYYDKLLRDRDIKCLAVDDSHAYQVEGKVMYFRGFIVIEDGLEPLRAVQLGHYYSSTGAMINEIKVEGKHIEVITDADVEIMTYNALKECTIHCCKSLDITDEVISFRAICYQGEEKAWTNLISV